MPIAAWITLARDVLIVGALGYILWFIHHADQNAVKVGELKAVEQQLASNAAQQSRWTQEFRDAEAQRVQDTATIVAAVGNHTAPIRLCPPAGTSPVPSHPATPSGGTTATGGTDAGLGADLRPAISAFELKYESYLSACRVVLGSWPR